MDVDDSEDEQASAAERKASARSQALRVLGRREQSGKELQAKLISQGFDQACASEVVQDLAKIGWQSDRRYAELLVRSRIAQGYGPRRIEAELATHGVDESTSRSALAEAECDWSELAESVYRKRFKTPAAKLADRQKRYRFLAGRGFDAEQIRKALRSDAPDDSD
ncbi:MAG: regulatory protein RecX [Nevskia sp.]|nr:regulatory protein RecX [Nevskia sp.]